MPRQQRLLGLRVARDEIQQGSFGNDSHEHDYSPKLGLTQRVRLAGRIRRFCRHVSRLTLGTPKIMARYLAPLPIIVDLMT
ncbi:hypothetical protein [Burkholderia sp. LMG 32019]|uniref:hypothetical protein n=1 Tax=Burkholderia sp. LMG 32019 TaxID=3158173 RepID=UPI003C2AD2ED